MRYLAPWLVSQGYVEQALPRITDDRGAQGQYSEESMLIDAIKRRIRQWCCKLGAIAGC